MKEFLRKRMDAFVEKFLEKFQEDLLEKTLKETPDGFVKLFIEDDFQNEYVEYSRKAISVEFLKESMEQFQNNSIKRFIKKFIKEFTGNSFVNFGGNSKGSHEFWKGFF